MAGYPTAADRQRQAERLRWGMRQELKQSVWRTMDSMVLSLGDSLVAAVAEADARTAQQVRNVAEVFQRGIAPGQRKEMFDRIGTRAQKSVVASYDQVVTRGANARGNRYSYRVGARQPNKRYAGGKLRGALKSKRFYEATADGLRFVNVDLLNRTARQWARLNAGAGPRGQGSRRKFTVTWSNLAVGAIGIDQAPRPGFFLPRGYWWTRGAGQVVSADPGRIGQDEFFPMGIGPARNRSRLDTGAHRRPGPYVGPGAGIGKRRPSLGIKARNFLDAGSETIARELPRGYEKLYKDLWDQKVIGQGSRAQIPSKAYPQALRKRVRTTRNY